MNKTKAILSLFFIFFLHDYTYADNPLLRAYDGLDIKYRWLDTKNYDTHLIEVSGLHRALFHEFGYEFRQILGDNTLTHIGLNYGIKEGSHWFGFGILSASDKPFTSLNLVDFDVFYAFRIFQRTTGYDAEDTPYYSRLYLGLEYSSYRNYLAGYPMPVIRYEYSRPKVNVIVGLPLTYFNIDFNKYLGLEFNYKPVLDLDVAFNLNINKYNRLSLSFNMENDVYKLSNLVRDVYYTEQEKYYIDKISLIFRYKLNILDIVSFSPYVEFIIDGHRYTSKEIRLFSNTGSTGIGYAAGMDVNLSF